MDNKDFILKVPTFLKFKDEVDPKEQSLTITEAEFIADQIAELNKVTTYGNGNPFEFYTTYISVIDKDGSGKRIQKGTQGITEGDLNKTLSELEANCDYTTLEAYLREAIKAFNGLKSKLGAYSMEEYMKLKGYEIKNESAPCVTDVDILYSQNLGTIADYFKYQTYSSYYGNKVLHRFGALSKARTNFNERIKLGSEINQVGNELLMTEFVPTIEREKLDEIFFKVQGIQRNYQVKYNGLQKKLNDQLDEERRKIYDTQLRMNEDRLNYQNKIRIEYDKWRQEQLSLLAKLKIVLPNDFIQIFAKIKSKLNE